MSAVICVHNFDEADAGENYNPTGKKLSCSGSCHNYIQFTRRGKLLVIDVEKVKQDEFNRRPKLRLLVAAKTQL